MVSRCTALVAERHAGLSRRAYQLQPRQPRDLLVGSKDLEIHQKLAPLLAWYSLAQTAGKYTQVWPTSLTDYEPVTVTDLGSGVAVGPLFDASSAPSVVFQDDPSEAEVIVDVESQRLLADFSASIDKTSRALLKFTGQGQPWYVPIYIQSESLLGTPRKRIRMGMVRCKPPRRSPPSTI